MFPTGGWKPNKPHNVKSVATSNIAVLENEEVNNTEKKSRFGEAATLELSNNYFREKSPNSAAMLMESKAAARTLKVGSRGEDVKRLQENLNTLGYNTGKPDGIFGNGTKNAVIAFQRAKGLTADGIVGSGTQNAITRALNEKTAAANSNILKVGSKGAKVTQLQRNLNSLGYNAGTPDGAFGTGTKNAVVSFQKTYGLSADGVAGKATLDAIATTISRKSKGILSKGQVSNDVRNLQNDLKTLGYLASNADGAFGTGTEAAVKAFQKNHKLTQDGLVGASTRSQISAAVKAKIERENSVLKLGSKGDKVKNLQSNLNELGYKAGTPDGQFGSGTQDAVIRFQKTYGLTPDGQAGTNTLNAISKSLNYKRNNVLAKGQVSEDVRNLQNNLKSLGYLSGTADGAFGAGTEAALKAFQKRHGLTEDGLAGKNTRNILSERVTRKESTEVNPTPVYGKPEIGKGKKIELKKVPQKFGEDYLGYLSEMYEGKGCETISKGVGDNGGKSYGSYQLSSETGGIEDFMHFLKTSNSEIYNELNNAYISDNKKYGQEFDKAWTNIAKLKKEDLEKAEYTYAKMRYYKDSVDKIKKNYDFDITKRSFALKAVIFSRAVQNNGCSIIFKNAIDSKDIDLEEAKDDVIIKAIYDENAKFADAKRAKGYAKMQNNRYTHQEAVGKTLHYFRSSAGDVQAGVYNRLKYEEKETALELYKQIG